MDELIVTDEQARIISGAEVAIPIRDSAGKVIGHAIGVTSVSRSSVLTPDQVAAAEERLDNDGAWYTTAQVLDHLRGLDAK